MKQQSFMPGLLDDVLYLEIKCAFARVVLKVKNYGWSWCGLEEAGVEEGGVQQDTLQEVFYKKEDNCVQKGLPWHRPTWGGLLLGRMFPWT